VIKLGMRSGGRSVIWSGRRSGIRSGMIKTQSQNEEIIQFSIEGRDKVLHEVRLEVFTKVKGKVWDWDLWKVKSKAWRKLFK